MPKWEYKNLKYLPGYKEGFSETNVKNEEEYIHELNKLGENDWELVDILHYTQDGALFLVSFILKRQVNE
jgi:hypothetical protein